jgi:hypothetical protein
MNDVNRKHLSHLGLFHEDIEGEDMIVKSNEAQRRSFLGVDFVLLSHGPESMITKMLYKKGETILLYTNIRMSRVDM